MFFKQTSIAFLMLQFLLAVNANAAEYTMADLEALEGQQNVEEFFEHAKDIRPSLRQGAWSKMVVSMGEVWTKQLLASKSISSSEFSHFSTIALWPPLKEDEFFVQKRDKVALAYFKQCLQVNGSNCLKQMKETFINFERAPALGFQLAKLANSIKGTSANIWTYLSPIAQSPFGEFYCDKSPLYEALAKKIAQGEDKHSHKDCVKSFAKRAQIEIKSATDLQAKSLAFRGLSILGLLSPQEQNKQTIYDALAGALTDRNQWSQALKALSYYSDSQRLRKDLVADLKMQETLPDRLFSKVDSKQALALTKLMGKKFPELLDLYANKCLSWLRGIGDYPRGNPTPNCHSYFEMAKVIGSSPDGVIREYDQLVNSWKN